MKIRLTVPTPQWKEKIMDYKAEFTANGETLHGTALLGDYDSFEEWYSDVCQNSSEETVAEGWVPSTTMLAVDENDCIIGMIDLRHRLNDYLLNYGGHIGYSVRKSQRKKGYATQMLSLTLERAKDMGIDKVMLSCEKDNLASAKTIIKCGGVLENEVWEDDVLLQRYWIDVK